jgi:hypothetical protein
LQYIEQYETLKLSFIQWHTWLLNQNNCMKKTISIFPSLKKYACRKCLNWLKGPSNQTMLITCGQGHAYSRVIKLRHFMGDMVCYILYVLNLIIENVILGTYVPNVGI